MRKLSLVSLILLLILSGCNFSLHGGGSSGIHSNLYIAAWYVPYDSRGLQSFTDNISSFSEINPVWYNLNPDYFTTGAVPFTTNTANKSAIVSLARSHGIKILPTIQNWGISNFDPTVINSIINNPVSRSRHVAEIVNLVNSEGFDGIDIDYESLPASSRGAFSIFIAELNAALKQHQKLLAVDVYAKTSDATWDGAGAQDWGALGQNVDLLKIMAYDYHWVTFHAGPISPVDWLQDILKYTSGFSTLTGKVMIGLPFYGLKWGSNSTGVEITYQDAVNLAQSNNLTVSRASIPHTNPICSAYYQNVEPHFDFIKNGITYSVYYQDVQALRQRLQIISQYRGLVKGVTFWRLGGEDPLSWQEMNK